MAGFASGAKGDYGAYAVEASFVGLTNNHVIGLVPDDLRSSYDVAALNADHPNAINTYHPIYQPGPADATVGNNNIGFADSAGSNKTPYGAYPIILKEKDKNVTLPLNYVDVASFIVLASTAIT